MSKYPVSLKLKVSRQRKAAWVEIVGLLVPILYPLFHPRQPRKGAQCVKYQNCPLTLHTATGEPALNSTYILCLCV